jgi:hypothetical protein
MYLVRSSKTKWIYKYFQTPLTKNQIQYNNQYNAVRVHDSKGTIE